jgi:hypothetical protein
MKPRNRRKHTGRAESGGFFALPHAVMASPAFRNLSAHGVKLLCDLGGQYRGSNNGDLGAAWRVMNPLGWRSRDTLTRALRELIDAGLIEQTRQGGLNRCSLYALTWHNIDECGGKLDVRATKVPSGLWKEKQRGEKQIASTVAVSSRHGSRVSDDSTRLMLTRQAC